MKTNLEKILFNYNRLLFKLNNYEELLKLNGKKRYNAEEIKKLRNYFNVINNALNLLEPDLRNIVFDHYIKGIPKEKFYLSQATFYNKKKKALKKLSEILSFEENWQEFLQRKL